MSYISPRKRSRDKNKEIKDLKFEIQIRDSRIENMAKAIDDLHSRLKIEIDSKSRQLNLEIDKNEILKNKIACLMQTLQSICHTADIAQHFVKADEIKPRYDGDCFTVWNHVNPCNTSDQEKKGI